MTALQIAHAECANWRKDGKGCLGAIIDDDLQIRRCHPKPNCVLGTAGVRCTYFEECVAPMAASIENPARRAGFEAAVRAYRQAAKLPCADDRPCPTCGRPMEPRQRFCDVCAAGRRRETKRLSMAKSRVRCGQLSRFEPLETKGFVGVQSAGGYGDTGYPQRRD